MSKSAPKRSTGTPAATEGEAKAPAATETAAGTEGTPAPKTEPAPAPGQPGTEEDAISKKEQVHSIVPIGSNKTTGEKSDNESAVSDDEFRSVIADKNAVNSEGDDNDKSGSIDQGDPNKESDKEFACFEVGESLLCQLKEQSAKVLELNNTIKIKKSCCPRTICEEYCIEELNNKLIYELEHLLEMILEACECKEHLCNIVKNVMPKNNNSKRLSASSLCQELNNSLRMQEKLFSENVDIEDDRYKLQEELCSREQIIDCLQQKFDLLQSELCKIKRGQAANDRCGPTNKKANEIEDRLQNYRKKTDSLEKNFECMALTLKKLNYELECVQKDRQALDNYEKEIKHKRTSCPCPDHSSYKPKSSCYDSCAKPQSYDSCANPQSFDPCAKSTSYDPCASFKSPCHHESTAAPCQPDYSNMFNEYRKKENENNMLKEKLESFCRSASHDSSTDKPELDMVKKKCCELLEEQKQYKLLINEQAEQLEEYRNKFLCAQTRVEEQRCKIEALDSNNTSIEDRINEEIGRIKQKFQEKLKELCPLPKLVEEQKRSLCFCNAEKTDLEKKYKKCCEELCQLKEAYCKMEEQFQKLLCKERQMKKLMEEYDQMKFCIEKLAGDKRYLEAKVKQGQDELDNFRVESAKIVARNKECANANKEALQCQINRLEIELAQCRANSSMMIAEREDSLKQMQTKLRLLTTNFDEAQCQVKALKKQIEQLKNGDDECC